MSVLKLDTGGLDLQDCRRVLSGEASRLELTAEATRAVAESRRVVDTILDEGRTAYGVNTGVGRLVDVRLEPQELARFQQNLLRSHAAGVGPPLSEPDARLTLALRIATLARGYSGVSPGTLQALVALYNAGIVPLVPSQGSVGASGDLAPLAHVALVLLGEGRVRVGGRETSAAAALRKAGLQPHALQPKDGITLINGTQVTLALAARLVLEATDLLREADAIAACTLEALKGTDRAYAARIQELRPHPGQAASAANLRRMLAHSRVLRSHRSCGKVQDAYSLRCVPQVHGAARDALTWARETVERELASVTDNPLVFPDRDELVSCGNFHGQPLAMVMDASAAALTVLGGISERRVERLLNPDLSELPPFLVRHEGLHSGLMMAQVTAASLASENKGLSHPAGVDSIPTSAAREDYVSMSLTSARRALAVLTNTRHILAIELLCAAQGLEFLRPLEAGRGVEAACRRLRERCPVYEDDRALGPDIEAAALLLEDGSLLAAVEAETGPLK